MKKQLRIFVLTLIGAMSINSVCAQDFTKSQMKQAKKEAKALEKEGWKVTPGSLSLYKQRLNLVAVNFAGFEGTQGFNYGIPSKKVREFLQDY